MNRAASLILSMLLLLQCSSIDAQYIFKGYLGIEGGESFHYELHFKDSANYISGYAFTYSEKQKEVKAAIVGKVNIYQKTLQFQETKLIHNNGFKSREIICLLQAVLIWKEDTNQPSFSGKITSSDISQTACSNGSISIQNINDVAAFFQQKTVSINASKESLPKKINKINEPKQLRVVYDTISTNASVATKQSKTPESISHGVSKEIVWESDTIQMQLRDGGKLDNDKISIIINGQKFLEQFILTKEKKILYVPISSSKTTITIHAENVGSEPPNTADILLQDRQNQYHIVAHNEVGKAATINIYKKTQRSSQR